MVVLGSERIVVSLHRKRLARKARLYTILIARRFRLGDKKEAAGVAVAVILVGIMDIECRLVIR
jgi:hypothetical protein